MTRAFDWGLLEPLGGGADDTASDDAASDGAVLEALVDVERALVRAWAPVAGEELEPVAATLVAGALDRDRLLIAAREHGLPIMALVSELRNQADAAWSGAGAWVHRGATSQDVVDTGLVLVSKRALFEVRMHLIATGERLAEFARVERGTLVVARTLTQQAESTTLGARFAGWLDGVSSAIDAIDSATFPVQLAGAVGTGRAVAADTGADDTPARLRAALAAGLGLDDPGRGWHVERTPALALAGVAALVAATLGRLGRDLGMLARDGVLLTAHGGASSAIPNKHNPVDAVLLTANGLRAPGLLSTLHTAALSYDARPAGEWHAEWQAWRGLLRIALGSAAAAEHVGADLIVDPPPHPSAVEPAAASAAGVVVDTAVARFARVAAGSR